MRERYTKSRRTVRDVHPRAKLPRVAIASQRGEPMDFSVSEAVRNLTATVRRFLDEEVLPVERLVLERGFGAGGLEIERLRGRVREMGLLAPHMPREWGGGGLPFLDLEPLSEVLGRCVIGHYVL